MVKHPVVLRGYHAAINDHRARPVLVKRTDQEFIPAVLEAVGRKVAPDDLGKIDREDSTSKNPSLLRLFQPVHRTFNLVLLEAICDRPGSPRLNPRDIVSAGFVLRRVDNQAEEGWMLRDERVLGWSRPVDPKLDPDPRQRRPRLNAGNPHVNGRLARLFAALEPAAERVSPLFIAPPDVCAAAGRTVLYGMVPVTSAERSDGPQPAKVDPVDLDKIMPEFLRARAEPYSIPSRDSLSEIESQFVQELRLIQFGWRAFNDSPAGKQMRGLLNQIVLRFGGDSERLDTYLERLCDAVILGNRSVNNISLPTGWPRPGNELAAQIAAAAKRNLEAAITAGLPNEQRFDRAEAAYCLHAFMRVRSPDGCPPHLQWSEPSEPFTIVPWWQSGGGPLHTIALPDIDSDTVKKIVPNVAFAVPPGLAALLRKNSLKGFLEGSVDRSNGGGIQWICSFSIPIITICAFIVLNIFLTLLHIVFQWLFYIKVCLPYPSKR
jgi:hypothetical protein